MLPLQTQGTRREVKTGARVSSFLSILETEKIKACWELTLNKEREKTKLSGMRRGRRNVSSCSRESAGKWAAGTRWGRTQVSPLPPLLEGIGQVITVVVMRGTIQVRLCVRYCGFHTWCAISLNPHCRPVSDGARIWGVLLQTPSFIHLIELNAIATEHSSSTHLYNTC